MITITFHGWIIPLIITVCGFSAAYLLTRNAGGIAGPLAPVIGYGVALVLALIVWMIYGLAA